MQLTPMDKTILKVDSDTKEGIYYICTNRVMRNVFNVLKQKYNISPAITVYQHDNINLFIIPQIKFSFGQLAHLIILLRIKTPDKIDFTNLPRFRRPSELTIGIHDFRFNLFSGMKLANAFPTEQEILHAIDIIIQNNLHSLYHAGIPVFKW